MSEYSATPDRRRLVAGITLCSRADMGRCFRLRIDGKVTSAVTCRTLTRRPGMVHLSRSERGVILVTGITGRRSRNMRNVLAQRIASVMATCAASRNYTDMGIGSRFPQRSRVTYVAGLRCRNMGGRLGLST